MYRERDELKRSQFLDKISTYNKEDLVYLDESGIDSYIHSPYGWAKKGDLVHGEISGKRYARESFIAAKCGSKIFAPLCYKGTCDTLLFNLWVEEFLVPEDLVA